jgi:transmembrane sensor
MKKNTELIQKFLNGTISSKERELLKVWVNKNEENKLLFKEEIKSKEDFSLVRFDSDIAFEKFNKQIKNKTAEQKSKFGLRKYAAVIAIVVASAIFLKMFKYETETNIPNTIVADSKIGRSYIEEITITLADGNTRTIAKEKEVTILDANGNIVANQSNGSLNYQGKASSNKSKTVFNEIFIPNGQQFKLKLSDGTIVWLNSGSKLRFPQNFLNGEETRTVYLEGEAYFDVTTNKKKPFIVNSQNINIKVLGTRFNVSSYANDNAIATTLVEGAVNVYEAGDTDNALQLQPSYQATFSKADKSLKKAKVDTYLHTGWMLKKLYINDLKFSEILKRLERSHNVTFINNYPELDKEVFNGEFENEPLEAILNTIALSTPFNYNIEQNTITITPLNKKRN